jgi:hypothetical protein
MPAPHLPESELVGCVSRLKPQTESYSRYVYLRSTGLIVDVVKLGGSRRLKAFGSCENYRFQLVYSKIAGY